IAEFVKAPPECLQRAIGRGWRGGRASAEKPHTRHFARLLRPGEGNAKDASKSEYHGARGLLEVHGNPSFLSLLQQTLGRAAEPLRVSRASFASVGIQPVVRQESIDGPVPFSCMSFPRSVVCLNKSKRHVGTLRCGVFAEYHQQILPLLFHRNHCFRSAKFSRSEERRVG